MPEGVATYTVWDPVTRNYFSAELGDYPICGMRPDYANVWGNQCQDSM